MNREISVKHRHMPVKSFRQDFLFCDFFAIFFAIFHNYYVTSQLWSLFKMFPIKYCYLAEILFFFFKNDLIVLYQTKPLSGNLLGILVSLHICLVLIDLLR